MEVPKVGRKKLELAGKRFGRLLVIKYFGTGKKKGDRPRWVCLCDCGKEKVIGRSNLRSGSAVSCGCFAREQAAQRLRTHGGSKDPLWQPWNSMMKRCYKTLYHDYGRYGGRGIQVCERWRNFISFQADMKESFLAHAQEHGRKDTTLERVDNERGYSPENCNWATRKIQARNRAKTKFIVFDGKRKTLAEWAEDLNIPYGTLQGRITNHGWSHERAITTPVRKINKRK